MKGRISILKEDRIWQLRTQGYCYDTIAQIVNCKPGSVPAALKRTRQRPPLVQDPVKRGRVRGFLSDDQISDIRRRKELGETLHSIAGDYHIEISSVWCIVTHKTYKEPSGDSGYPFKFGNRLMHG